MTQQPNIDIVLATYNGERFLSEQIDSILSQSYQNWRLLIRDDGSQDTTGTILRRYGSSHPGKIRVIEDNKGNLGVTQNFARLLEETTADYIMFCDQDDVWLPEKIVQTAEKMKELTDRFGRDVPLLVYTDLKVVDYNLRTIAASYWNFQKTDPNTGNRLNRLLVSNVIVGCTVMINKKLRDLMVPVPATALMHDWWAGLISVALGKNACINSPTVLYRQHGENVAGATWSMSWERIAANVRDLRKHRAFLLKTRRQAQTFIDHYGAMLSDRDRSSFDAYAGLDNLGWWARRMAIIRHGYWWSGVLRNTVLMLVG